MSTLPLQNYFANQDQVGLVPLALLPAAARAIAARRARRNQVGAMEALDGIYGLDDTDEDIGAALDDEEEIGALESDEDEIGASGERIDRKLAKVRAKLKEKRAELSATPERKLAKRRVLKSQIRRLERKANRLEDKSERKHDRADRRGGAAAAGAGGAAAGAAMDDDEDEDSDSAGADMPQNIGIYQGAPGAGELVEIPFYFSSVLYTAASFAAGASANTAVSFTGATNPITYAKFKVRGVKVTAWLQWAVQATSNVSDPTSQAMVYLSNVTTDGGLNLLYDAQVLALSGNMGNTQVEKTITGLRWQDMVDRQETVNVTGSVTNLFATTAATGAFKVSVAVALLLDVKGDSKLNRYVARR